MTTEEARQHLEAADKRLASIVDQLVMMPSGAGQVVAELREVAEKIRNVHVSRASFRPTKPMARLLASVRAQIVHAQLLLDSAAAFYCGAISAHMPYCGMYTPDGEVRRGANSGCLRVEA